mmetsp:Transcript_10807/g.11228  ORF Transcript_10807/g.11228 Transcript_10807/m.11228 type:complete len:339 (-) Transcript_10807:128-1144(-)
MALFGDEQRFYPGICESNGISNIYGKNSTGENIGPGFHFERDLADKRNGWTPLNSNKRPPMRKGEKEMDRSDFYVKNQLTPSGIIVPHSADKYNFPSPGQYDPDSSTDYASRMKNTLQKSLSSPHMSTSVNKGPSFSMGSSPRMTSNSSVIRDGIIISGGEDFHSSIRGPGTYFQSIPNELPTTTLAHKSSNVRSNSGNSKGVETAREYLSNNTPSSPRNVVTPRQQSNNSNFLRTSPEKTSPSFGSPRYAINTPVLGSPKAPGISTLPVRPAVSTKGYLNGGPGGGYGPGVPTQQPKPDNSQLSNQEGQVSGTSSPHGRGTPTGLYAATPTRHKADR